MNEDILELPRLKKEVQRGKKEKENIIILDDKLNQIIDLTPKKRINYILCFSFAFFMFGTIFFFMFFDIKLEVNDNYVDLKNIDVLSYDAAKNLVELSIEPTSDQVECYFDVQGKDRVVGKLKDNKCILTVTMNSGEVTFINERDLDSKSFVVTDYVVDVKEKNKYYLPLNKEIELGEDVVVVGNPTINWISLGETVRIVDNKLKAVKVGQTTVRAVSNGDVVHEIDVVVTDTIIEMPKKFNKNKPYLPCREFTSEEAELLDEILAYRINEVGYGTRAAAVEAARFLTLEFPYRLTYFYETGRLNTPGRVKVDGEGRYYHKGLYLSETKFKDIAYVGNGPAIWGCGLRCYEDAPPYFKPGSKYPNGLSCSGFVTWVLYNAGFDVGDIGAGESPYPHQLTDTGKFTSVTNSLIKSGKIKVGDLFNVWGHISILVGEDNKNYYIAESLDTFGGVVINTYSKKNVAATFPYVVLMDELYKEDGSLTDLWY